MWIIAIIHMVGEGPRTQRIRDLLVVSIDIDNFRLAA
jgi:hypothetical protein